MALDIKDMKYVFKRKKKLTPAGLEIELGLKSGGIASITEHPDSIEVDFAKKPPQETLDKLDLVLSEYRREGGKSLVDRIEKLEANNLKREIR